MIPIIGWMMGMYILTRMVELSGRKETGGLAWFFIVITFFATIGFMIALGVMSS